MSEISINLIHWWSYEITSAIRQLGFVTLCINLLSYKHKRWDAETSRINWFESNVISSHIELALEPQIVGDTPTNQDERRKADQ